MKGTTLFQWPDSQSGNCMWLMLSSTSLWLSAEGALSVLQIYVFFPEEAKVGVKTIKNYTNIMKSENVPRAILVVQQNLTPFAKTCISEISSKFFLEVFQVNMIFTPLILIIFFICECKVQTLKSLMDIGRLVVSFCSKCMFVNKGCTSDNELSWLQDPFSWYPLYIS